MHGIVSLLDDDHYRLVEAIWADLADKVGVRGAYVTPFPHYSYHVAEHYEVPQLHEILSQIAAQTPPFVVNTTGIGIYTGGLTPVVYITVSRSPLLTRLHKEWWSRFVEVSSGILTYYHPEEWIPHITLGHGDVTNENLPDVIRALSRWDLVWKVPINNLALLYDDSVSHRDRLQFRIPLTGG
jgi:2'-5' RNA ligase